MIGIIDYGSGNIDAILKIYRDLNIPCTFITCATQLEVCSHYILPGVGDFDETVTKLRDSGIIEPLEFQVKHNKKPILGICVGMQILGDSSEEGTRPGLGWISGRVKKIDQQNLSIKPYLPHMGWNNIESRVESSILAGIEYELGFYFIHSYYFECMNGENILSETNYGGVFTSSIFKENIFGTQFHPEKSHSNGVKLFQNFYKLSYA